MAFTALTNLGTNSDKTSGTTLTVTTAVAVLDGEFIVLAIAKDNSGTVDGAGSEISSVSGGGLAWSTDGYVYSKGSAAAGATAAVAWAQNNTGSSIASGTVITITFVSAITAKAVTALRLSVGSGSTVSAYPSSGRGDSADPGALTVSGLTSGDNHLGFRVVASESSSTTVLTATSGWGALSQAVTSGGGSTSNMGARGEYITTTGVTSLTSDPTGPSSIADQASVLVVFKEVTSAGGALTGSSDGIATASGVLTGDTALAGSAAGIATAAGTLTGQTALAGSSAGIASASGLLVSLLVGSSAGAATATASLTGSTALAGSSDGVATAAGVLTGSTALAGSSAGTASASGTLVSLLVGISDGIATAAGTLTGSTALTASSAGVASASGTLTALVLMVGSSDGIATASGTLSTSGGVAGALVGSSDGVATATGTLTGSTALTGSSVGVASASGVLTGSTALTGSSAGSSTATALLSGGVGFAQLVDSAFWDATASNQPYANAVARTDLV